MNHNRSDVDVNLENGELVFFHRAETGDSVVRATPHEVRTLRNSLLKVQADPTYKAAEASEETPDAASFTHDEGSVRFYRSGAKAGTEIILLPLADMLALWDDGLALVS